MLATFLLTVGQNSRYCLTRKTFGRAHSTSSRNFNKILKALNTIASDMMVKPGSTVPSKYFLVDWGFANRRQFLAPFRGVRYHLQDFGGQGRNPENANEVFNLRHASLRNVIERIFSIFKSQFTILKSAPPYPFRTQAELVLAYVGLHNFLHKECRSDEFPVEPNNKDSSPSLVGFEVDDDIF
ncbi:putative harbinger transposase-derived nuclease [Abeliophyllum distichum]|uniref:Harbinger transposase-derived nuclease n=1 Tax=Abeliophyllum distichum TaxID=126358 RepID=A0ABD1PP95_9LAMI